MINESIGQNIIIASQLGKSEAVLFGRCIGGGELHFTGSAHICVAKQNVVCTKSNSGAWGKRKDEGTSIGICGGLDQL